MNHSSYANNHANRVNLLIHALAVPTFWLASIALIVGLFAASWQLIASALLGISVSMAAQGFGHKLERIPPETFDGPADFAKRIFVEQFYRFPVFVLSGRFWQALNGKPERE